MNKGKDLSGMRFGLLMIKSIAETRNKRGDVLWICLCDCGKEKLCTTGALWNGMNISCGCMNGGKTHGDWNKRIRVIWVNMMARCYKENASNYLNYGGKGIKVCDEWHDYQVFKEWAFANGYTDDLTIDRIDVTGNYHPHNCRWATPKEQARNKTNNRYLLFNGESKTLAEWSETYGINQGRVSRRIMTGWTIEDALTRPIDKKRISKIYRHAS